jgi:hypothetical protein
MKTNIAVEEEQDLLLRKVVVEVKHQVGGVNAVYEVLPTPTVDNEFRIGMKAYFICWGT